MLFLLGWLIHFLIFGDIGEILARSAKLPEPQPVGWIVGGLVPGGVLVLLIVWIVQWARGRTA